ncbi:MAG: sensor histidine kinase [Desulfuromonadaceae bacterium]
MGRVRRTSLRTEIIISTALLVGAALLFITMLLIRLGENDRLAEQVRSYRTQSRILAHALAQLDPAAQERVLYNLSAEEDLRALLLVNDTLETGAGSWAGDNAEQAQTRQFLRRALLQSEPVLELRHPASWLESSGAEAPGLQVARGFQGTTGKQALYLHFPLQQVRARTLEQLQLALWICLGYGLVLIGASTHILRRAVITPVEALTRVTEALMHGRSGMRVDPEGPREIATLGQSFNQMATTLEQNQVEQRRQVEELQDKNRELSATRLSLMQAARMASVGHLASGMAHEIGNPLSAVLAYLDLARRKGCAEECADLLDRAEAEARRIDHIIRDMLDYAASDSSPAQQAEPHCPHSDPLQVIHETVEMLRHQGVFKQRDLQLDLAAPIPECCIPSNRLQQILVNLILNARDATSADGSIQIRACAQPEAVEIMVQDNGCGMSQEQQQAAFDPFFSGGKRGGRGLGLFVCYQQLKECGGDILLSSTPGEGSCFTVFLKRHTTGQDDENP